MPNSVSLPSLSNPQATQPAQPILQPPDWPVFLVWDASAEQKELVCVFATEDLAQAFIDENYDEDESDQIAIEECRAVGSAKQWSQWVEALRSSNSGTTGSQWQVDRVYKTIDNRP